MKRFLLILIVIIITSSMVLVGVGCTTAAAAQPTIAEFIGSDFELSLPEGWEGGRKDELDPIIENLKKMGQEQLAEQVEASLSTFLFWGYDTEAAASGGNISTFNITGDSSAAFLSLNEYMDLSYKNVAESYEKAGYTFNIIKEDVVPIGNYEEVGRTIFEQTVKSVETKMAQYIIKNGSDFWVLTFIAMVEQFDQDIQTFDKTIETFKIIE
ncbi:MAG: hypothetical protein IMZ51_01670 [Chloroflexi bacterium]|nr:hypothetical protein [Chloroflexota bacterium]MBE3114549.1 hypothetical protein [Actinomycetota bacterium]